MPENDQDVNWKQEIVNIGKDVVHIKGKIDNVVTRFDSMEGTTITRLNDHADRLRAVEQKQSVTEGEEKAKEWFYQRHPIKTGVTVGGGGAVTLFGGGQPTLGSHQIGPTGY